MKKGITLIAMTALISLAACNNQPKVKTMATAEAPEVAIDSACMKANAGKYMTYDGKRSITLIDIGWSIPFLLNLQEA